MTKHFIKEILFVDDSSDEAFVSNLILESAKIDLKIIHFCDYRALSTHLDTLDDETLAVVVVDLNMPLQKGTELIAELYSNYSKTRVIAGIFSGSEDPKDREETLEAGALFFIPKPMDKVFFDQLCSSVPQISMVNSSNGLTSLVIVN